LSRLFWGEKKKIAAACCLCVFRAMGAGYVPARFVGKTFRGRRTARFQVQRDWKVPATAPQNEAILQIERHKKGHNRRSCRNRTIRQGQNGIGVKVKIS
jgi:hypothetical protein